MDLNIWHMAGWHSQRSCTISTQQWQLACTGYQAVVNAHNQRHQIMENNQTTQQQINNFNDLIRENNQSGDSDVPAVEIRWLFLR